MKIGLYSPYLDSVAGGERYILTLATHWSKSHDVRLFWNDLSIKDKVNIRLNLDLSRVRIVPNLFRGSSIISKALITQRLDVLVVLSDGSIPVTFAKHNIIHFQRPFVGVGGKSWLNRIKLSRYQKAVCNSAFTKRYIDREYGIDSIVIYPPVSVNTFKQGKKQKIILSVGRFTNSSASKKQKEMLQIFRKINEHHPDWSFYLAGGLLEQDKPYFDEVSRISTGLSVHLLPNIPFSELMKLYEKAAIYWHAAGYTSDSNDPGATEHFGISTVEAMAAGCVPIVFNGGGLPEIVKHETNGILWNTSLELINSTERIISQVALRQKYAKAAQVSAMVFDESRFESSFDSLLREITHEKI